MWVKFSLATPIWFGVNRDLFFLNSWSRAMHFLVIVRHRQRSVQASNGSAGFVMLRNSLSDFSGKHLNLHLTVLAHPLILSGSGLLAFCHHRLEILRCTSIDVFCNSLFIVLPLTTPPKGMPLAQPLLNQEGSSNCTTSRPPKPSKLALSDSPPSFQGGARGGCFFASLILIFSLKN